MRSKKVFWLIGLIAIAAVLMTACGGQTPAAEEPTEAEEFVFGVILVGPKNDRGWSQAHFEGGQYIEQNIENSRMIVFESLNPADKPEATVEGVVDEMVEQGAKLIFLTSDEFEEDTVGAANKYPDVTFIMVSGDDAWREGRDWGKAPSNVGNIMGRMEDMKAVAGCAAALTTQTGKIGYVGPLINYETRRLVASTYLGARYCYENYRGLNPDDLEFTVTWIGFWFNIPGVTLDPTEVVNQFLDSGIDVVMSGIDTTEAIDVTGQRAAQGAEVFAIPYDFRNACDQAPDICLGVPYFNWGPSYLAAAQSVIDGTWEQDFEWLPPYWEDLNNLDRSHVGWVTGPGMSDTANLEDFISKLASGEVNVWTGPIVLQDGTTLVGEGEVATDLQIWYLEKLPEGVIGPSE
ncbi:MAG: BMP family ABC transporter substrate-binding protein [Anaerolineae bacterium]